mgnify:CR=1 FL=1
MPRFSKWKNNIKPSLASMTNTDAPNSNSSNCVGKIWEHRENVRVSWSTLSIYKIKPRLKRKKKVRKRATQPIDRIPCFESRIYSKVDCFSGSRDTGLRLNNPPYRDTRKPRSSWFILLDLTDYPLIRRTWISPMRSIRLKKSRSKTLPPKPD